MRDWRTLRRIFLCCAGVLVVGAVAAVFGALAAAGNLGAGENAKEGSRIYELRIYTTHEGRLDALHKRFRDHTCKLFEKHGMTLVGFWTPTEGDKAQNTLVYLLSFPSLEARNASFEAFRQDPEWQAAFKASHVDGLIVDKVESQFLTPTDYSPLK